MIKVYDRNKQFLKLIDEGLKDIKITEDLETGYKSLFFKVPCLEEYFDLIQEENYVRTKDYEFIIKENTNIDNQFIEVYCKANVEDLEYVFEAFDCYDKNVEQAYTYALQPTGWTCQYYSQDRSVVVYQVPYINSMQACRYLAEMYEQDIWFDTLNKVVEVYDYMGQDTELYGNQRYLKQLSQYSNTYDFATVLYPIGKNNLTIGELNNGRDYLENYTYCNKRVEKTWLADYDRIEDLIKYGQQYLDKISQPITSYKIELTKLGEINLGDRCWIVDQIKHIKTKQRCVKVVRYPKAPEKSYIEIANESPDFIKNSVKSQKKMEKDLRWVKEFLWSLD